MRVTLGGPIVLGKGEPENGMLEPLLQVGIVSWGWGCAEDWPGIYTRVSDVWTWVTDTVCQRTQELCPPAAPGEEPPEPGSKSAKSGSAKSAKKFLKRNKK